MLAPATTSDRALRACMQGLVLLNLVFVQLTGTAGLHWLLPLYALTLAAPSLERLREKLWYRAAWNLGVMAFLSVLFAHVLGRQLAYVLEDGLVLAVLCQVHLLNNLRTGQRPHLLFTNAFLIALITGFMTRDLSFAAAFLVFAPFYVVGHQLLSAGRGGRVLAPEPTRRLVRDGLTRSGVLLGLSLLAFLFWPRDFDRKPVYRGTFEFVPPGEPLELGFNEKLDLDRSGTVHSSDAAALRVTVLRGSSADVSPLWRGSTLGATTGSTWHPVGPLKRRRAGDSDPRWVGQRGALVREGGVEPGWPQVRVVRYAQDTERLFAPLDARALELGTDERDVLLRARHDGTVDVARSDDVTYTLTLAPRGGLELGGAYGDELPRELRPFVELPETPKLALALRLGRELADGAPEDVDEQHELVELVRSHLALTYRYLPPGTDGAARSLDEFLRGEAGGHCEFFASALATMLRGLGVPCRVVTGYRGDAWDARGTTLSFGLADAHAWVEVHDPTVGWYAADPSPVLVEEAAVPSAWERLTASARGVWETVTDFDEERRAAAFAWARALPGRAVRATREEPLRTLAVLLAVAVPVGAWVARRRRRTPPAVRGYAAALRAARLRRRPGETPRELLARAARDGLEERALARLEEATRRHEAARYAA